MVLLKNIIVTVVIILVAIVAYSIYDSIDMPASRTEWPPQIAAIFLVLFYLTFSLLGIFSL